MSWQASAYVAEIESGITRSEKLTLLILANHHNTHTSRCDASIPRLAKETLLSERRLQAVLESLRRKGFIGIQRRPGHTNQYMISALDTPAMAAGVNQAPTPAISARTPAISSQRGAVSDHGNRKVEPKVRTVDQDQARAREKSSAEWYELVTERKPTSAMANILEGIDFSHPPPCVKSTWESAASASEPWPYAKRIFDMCGNGLQEHGPRAATNGRTNGRSQEGRNQGGGGSTDRRREEAARRRGGEW